MEEDDKTEISPKQTTTYVKKQIKLDIPLITPEGKCIGLGISVKGKNTGKPGEPRQPYGLFIKNILKDGAAHLVSINYEVLCHMSFFIKINYIR